MNRITRVGIVGGGQLAVMMAEAGARLGVEVSSLASRPDDPVVGRVPRSFVGDPRNASDLCRLAEQCDVLTFDHELIDTEVIALLEGEGVLVRPGAAALSIAINKRRQWEVFHELELAQPETVIVDNCGDALAAIRSFHGAAVLKTAIGGYDGRGVLLDVTESSVREWYPAKSHSESSMESSTVLVQRRAVIESELAVQVVRGAGGALASYAPVRTVQSDGMCASVQVPSAFDRDIEKAATNAARRIAEAINVVGILAVEFFLSDGQLLVNELAARPHNSGHLTIEAARTSQFENHLRAVVGQDLGPTDLVVPAAAMVNIVGRSFKALQRPARSANVAIHVYGKTPRPGRKLGHVTAVADSPQQAVALANCAARQLETETE